MNYNMIKKLSAALLTVTIATTSCIGASACTGMYIGNEKSENGSTFVGRSEDIGKLYDKVFDVHPAADHEEGEMYQDTYGFEMPFPAHTYRYTIMRDSYKQGETMQDENGNYIGEAYGEVGINENGVAVSATVSTYLKKTPADPLVGTGICEISLNSVILQSAKTAKEGVEILAAIIDEYGSGEYNSLTISDGNEVWDFEIVSGHQYAALKMPADKVSVNPNLMIMREIDVADTENVIASENLIQVALENGTLASSQLDENGEPTVDVITKIDVAKSYGGNPTTTNTRYWQGVNYLAAKPVSDDPDAKETNILLDTDETFSTYEALRLLGYRGEGTEYENVSNSIGKEAQAECHVFEIREGMPEDLAIIQWQTMSRAEFSVYMPFYSALLTETSDLFKTEYVKPKGAGNIEQFIDKIPEDSAYWAFAALNDLCDNDRELYGKNVKLFWEGYQKSLIEQQEAIDEAMLEIYAYDPALAEEKATALGKVVAEQTFDCAKSMVDELWAHIKENPDEEFIPSVLTEDVKPEYSIDMVGGTGIPTASPNQLKVKKVFNNGAIATWSAPKNIKGVEYQIFCDSVLLDTVTEQSYELSGLEAGQEYTISVYAVDEDGDKTLVGTVTFQTTDNHGHETAQNPGKGNKK